MLISDIEILSSDNLKVDGFTESDFESEVDDRRSMSRYVFV